MAELGVVVGFTGSREGMSRSQREALCRYLEEHTVVALHHGDCVGADSEAHNVALSLGIPIHVHPPLSRRLRAFRGGVWVGEPKGYMERNRDIVDAAGVVLAAPRDVYRQTGGTWAAIRYALRVGKPVTIL